MAEGAARTGRAAALRPAARPSGRGILLKIASSPIGAVVIGGYVNGLNAARALARQGVQVAVVSTRPFDIAHRSRAVRTGVVLRGFHEHPDRLLDLLRSRERRWEGALLLATEDLATEILARNRAALEPGYRVASPPWPVVQQLLHKDRLTTVAEAVGVDVPRRFTTAAALAGSGGVEFPVVVKPHVSHLFAEVFERKVHLARNRAELARMLEQCRQRGLAVQIQEWIPGGDESFFNYSVYLDREGRRRAECAMHKIRKSPPLVGVCRVGELASWNEPMEHMRDATLRILSRVGWHGMANAEFKIDPRTGRPVLMEINGRCFLMHAVALQAGINYPWLAWAEATQGRVPDVSPQPWDGAWIHLHADLLHAVFSSRADRPALGAFLAPYRRRRAYAVWSARDPAPFCMQWLHTAGAAAKFLVRRAAALRATSGRRAGLREPTPLDTPAASTDWRPNRS